MNIDLSKETLALSDFKEYRLEMLRQYIEIIELFDKYYIEDYNSGSYKLRIYPPFGLVDGPVFGSVNPAIIKDKEFRDKYISELEENNKIGEMNAFQSALTAVKRLLESPDAKFGIITSIQWFINCNYKGDSEDQDELKENIEDSQLNQSIKNGILDAMTQKRQ